jgi:hypothetical protein
MNNVFFAYSEPLAIFVTCSRQHDFPPYVLFYCSLILALSPPHLRWRHTVR